MVIFKREKWQQFQPLTNAENYSVSKVVFHDNVSYLTLLNDFAKLKCLKLHDFHTKNCITLLPCAQAH